VQLKLLPLAGFFPWECVMCRSRAFYRDDGHQPLHTEANPTGTGLKTA
jgi:hypothetical protein